MQWHSSPLPRAACWSTGCWPGPKSSKHSGWSKPAKTNTRVGAHVQVVLARLSTCEGPCAIDAAPSWKCLSSTLQHTYARLTGRGTRACREGWDSGRHARVWWHSTPLTSSSLPVNLLEASPIYVKAPRLLQACKAKRTRGCTCTSGVTTTAHAQSTQHKNHTCMLSSTLQLYTLV
jgi:hypothetical protein